MEIGPDSIGLSMRPISLRMYKFSWVTYTRSYSFPAHTHSWIEIIVVKTGSYSCELNGTHLTVMPGEMLIVQPDDRHTDEYKNRSEVLYLMYDMRGIDGRVWPHGIFTHGVPVMRRIQPVAANRQLKTMLNNIIAHTKKSRFMELAVEKLGEALLWESLDAVPDALLSRELIAALDVSGFHRTVLDYFSRIMKEKLSVPTLASHMGMSKRSFEYRFRNYFRTSPVQLFNEYRMGIALQLLEQGLGIPEVAVRFGYEDQSYFSTVFKRVMGFPPSQTDRQRRLRFFK